MAPVRPSHVEQLVEAGLRGDRVAFDSLYEVWFAAVWSAARQDAACGDEESATAQVLQRAVADRLQGRAEPAAALAVPDERSAAHEA